MERGGTDAQLFSCFCDHVCTQIELSPIAGLDNQRYFLWDNLSTHECPVIHQTVEMRNGPCKFDIIKRPPYQPKYGPVEYAICMITMLLRDIVTEATSTQSLKPLIRQAAANVGRNEGFNNTFDHCGYTEDGNYP